MQQRYAVVVTRLRGHEYHTSQIKAFRSAAVAERHMQTWGDARREFTTTRALYHHDRRRRGIDVVDLKTGRTLSEYELRIVPSVGEVGVW